MRYPHQWKVRWC